MKNPPSEVRRGFEDIKQVGDNGAEYWSARDLMPLLGYTNWQNFLSVIEKAREAILVSGLTVAQQLTGVDKLSLRANGAATVIDDYHLSRFACYLIAQNGDSRKPQIAAAQTYFAVQTRRQEATDALNSDVERLEARQKLKETQKALKGTVYQRGVKTGSEFAVMEDNHNREIYGGHSTKVMKAALGVPGKRPLADFEAPVILKAKDLSLAMSDENIQKKDLKGTIPLNMEVMANGRAVRKTLVERGIKPELRPAEEDIKKVERRVKKQIKNLDPGKVEQLGAGDAG